VRIGAHYISGENCEFVVWAPFLKRVEIKIVSPREKTIPMAKDARGYWRAILANIPSDTKYFYNRLEDERDRPDPASQFQPEGVHGPSQIVDHDSFQWEDADWNGIVLPNMVMYELHIGTFTRDGTFDAVIPRILVIRDLGVNAIEIMPIAEPGAKYRNIFTNELLTARNYKDATALHLSEVFSNSPVALMERLY